MPIERKTNGFLEWDAEPKLSQGRGLGLESGRIEECMAHYNAGGFTRLFGSRQFGFREDNLNFLTLARTQPSEIWFWDIELRDVEAVYGLSVLKEFGINSKRPGINFSRFKCIFTVINDWIRHDTGLSKASIQKYGLSHFKPRSKSFSDTEIPISVQSLHLTWANPQSLEGLPLMPDLTELQIHRCRNLSDISLLPSLAPNLKKLIITTSSRLNPTSGILDHPKLSLALVDGKKLVS
jgi:hypothetical protein